MIIKSLQTNNNKKLENIAVIGNGGRENSLAWAIGKNSEIKNIYMIPGNGGSKKINKCKIKTNSHRNQK